MENESTEIISRSLTLLRRAGRGHVRRRLEQLVNDDIIGFAGAQKIYRDAFGGELKAIRPEKTSKWFGWI
jgi:hypothetical protein